MIKALFAKIWPYIAVVGAVLAGLFAVRQSGKAAARTEDAAKLNKAQERAREEAKNVDAEIDALGSADLRRRGRKWLRDD